MAKYIDKTTVKAEVKRLAEVGRNNASGFDEYRKEKAVWLQQADVCDRILSFIDTLEVKEVDLEKEIDEWYNTKASKEFENVFYEDIEECAKHFFGLGLKAKGE